jgi:hypothetical protein
MFIIIIITIMTPPLKMTGRCVCANLCYVTPKTYVHSNRILKKLVSPSGVAVQVGKYVVKNDGEGTDYFLCAIRLLGSLFFRSSP